MMTIPMDGMENPAHNALWNKEVLMQGLYDVVDESKPRLFALCEIMGDHEDGQVFAWGAQFEETALVFSEEGGFKGVFSSAERARQFFSRHINMLLVWPNASTFAAPGRTIA